MSTTTRLLKKHITVGKNDLATTHPHLIPEWHPTLNEELTPQDFSYGSGHKIYWQCKHGHEWIAQINSRAKGTKCPHCNRLKSVIVGKTDLATTHPHLAAEWHPTLNGLLTPQDVSAGMIKRVHWLCKHGHEWDATLNTRSSGSKCPECRMLFRATAGVDDLATTHPHLAAEWHPTKNGEMKPQHVKAGSGKRVHWQCKHGHEWEAFIAHRSKGNVCPHCRKLNSKNKKEL